MNPVLRSCGCCHTNMPLGSAFLLLLPKAHMPCALTPPYRVHDYGHK